MTSVRTAALVLLVLAAGLAGCSSDGAERAGGATPSGAPSDGASSAAPTAASTNVPSRPAPADPSASDSTAGTQAPGSVPPPPLPTSTEVVPAPADGAIPELPPVAVGATVDAGGGLTAEVVSLDGAEITGGVPGDVAGPAVAVTVAVTNTGGAPADVGLLTVSAGYGDGQEAPGYDGAPADPFEGPVPAGGTEEGTYVFGVPDLGTGTLVVRVGTDPARPLAVFTADASVWGDR